MITRCNSLSIRRRRSGSDGKNDPARNMGICTSASPAVVGTAWADPVAADCASVGALVAGRADRLGEHGAGIGGLERIELVIKSWVIARAAAIPPARSNCFACLNETPQPKLSPAMVVGPV